MTMDSCPACGSSQSRHWCQLSRGAVQECVECRTLFVPHPTVSTDHASEFYANEEPSFERYFRPLRLRQYQLALNRLGLAAGSRHLDVGCSYGWLVQAGLERGLDSHGIEPGGVQVADAALQQRIETLSLEQLLNRKQPPFDLITLWHVLEHFERPNTALEQVKTLMGTSGHIAIAVPSRHGGMFRLASLAARFGATNLLETLFYTHNANMHFVYFSKLGLERLMQRAGFQTLATVETDGFDWRTMWIRVASPVRRLGLRLVGPLLHASRWTARENLVVCASRVAT